MRIILGSGSPRRKNILENIFDSIQVISPSVDERTLNNEKPDDYTERVTNLKMDSIILSNSLPERFVIITSDTIVAIDEKILGKPLSEKEAVSMLRTLSGREHSVITGLCIVHKDGAHVKRIYDSEKTLVKFMDLDEKTIKRYLKIVDYSDKAGSYAIQDHGELLVKSVIGSMTNVVGFPLRLFFRMIKRIESESILV